MTGVTTAFERLKQALRKLPGVGYRSSERIALHLLLGKPEQLQALVAVLYRDGAGRSRGLRFHQFVHAERARKFGVSAVADADDARGG